MLDVDTFLTILYVMVDDFCQSRAPKMRRGPEASLCASEVITLAIFARWSRFASERDFYRYAQTKLRSAFPTLPDRSQFNRCVRLHTGGVVALPLGARRDFIEACLKKRPIAVMSASPRLWRVHNSSCSLINGRTNHGLAHFSERRS